MLDARCHPILIRLIDVRLGLRLRNIDPGLHEHESRILLSVLRRHANLGRRRGGLHDGKRWQEDDSENKEDVESYRNEDSSAAGKRRLYARSFRAIVLKVDVH